MEPSIPFVGFEAGASAVFVEAGVDLAVVAATEAFYIAQIVNTCFEYTIVSFLGSLLLLQIKTMRQKWQNEVKTKMPSTARGPQHMRTKRYIISPDMLLSSF